MKKPSLTTLKKKAWKLLSVLVRTDELDSKGRAKCFTCGIKKPWKKMYAGHFVQGRRPSILLVEKIIRVQCVGCNRFRHGNLNRFTVKMFYELGVSQVIFWLKRAEVKVDRTPEYYEKKIKGYLLDIKDLRPKVKI